MTKSKHNYTGEPPALPAQQEIPVRVVFNPLALRDADSKATFELLELADADVTDDDDARAANEDLRLRQAELNAVEAMLAETLAPLALVETSIRKLFDPTRNTLKAVVFKLRSMLTTYETAKRVAHREALEEAAAAAQLSTPQALQVALATAEANTATQLEGTTFRRRWVVKRIVEGLLPFNPPDPHAPKPGAHYWTPDMKKLEALGKAHKFDTPPEVDGVIWEEKLSSVVRGV